MIYSLYAEKENLCLSHRAETSNSRALSYKIIFLKVKMKENWFDSFVPDDKYLTISFQEILTL